MVTGEIVQISPSVIAVRQPIIVYVTFNAYAPGRWDKGTSADISITLNSFKGSENFWSISDSLEREGELIRVSGVMPNRSLSGTIVLKVLDFPTLFTKRWTTVDSKSFTINLPVEMPTITPLPPALVVTPKPVPDEKEWWEFWKDEPAPDIPSLPLIPIPDGEPVTVPLIPKDKSVWVGLGLVAVAVVGLLVFRR